MSNTVPVRMIGVMKVTRLTLGLAVAVMFAVSFAAAESPKKRLAVLDFDYGLVRNQVVAIFRTEVDVGRGMRDLILKHLTQDGTYTTVDLKALDKMLAQQGLAPDDRTSAAAAARFGRILGVDAVLMGTITQFGGEKKERKIEGTIGGEGPEDVGRIELGKVRGVVGVDARVVDIDSGEVLAVFEGHGELTRVHHSLLTGSMHPRGGSLDLAAVDFSNRNFEKTPLGKAVKQAAEQLTAKIIAARDAIPIRQTAAEGLLILVEEQRVVLNLGSRAGLKVGDQLPVERVTQEVKDPATGKIIRRLRQPIGMVEVTEVHEESADAQVLSGSGFVVGDVARTGKMTASGPATEILAAILAREIEKRKAAGLYDDDAIEPSAADLRIGRTIFIHPLPYDLHLHIQDALLQLAEPLVVVTDNRRQADLWMRGTVKFAAKHMYINGEEVVARVTASVMIVPRGGTQPLWAAKAKKHLRAQDRTFLTGRKKMAASLVKKLRKRLRRK